MSEKQFVYLTGLPRSGQSLLRSLLNQNPEIYCSTESPVGDVMANAESTLINSPVYLAAPKPESLKSTISSIIDNYYSNTDKPIIVDSDKGWCVINRFNLLLKYRQNNLKLICLVRPVVDILCSYLALLEENTNTNFIDEMLKQNPQTHVGTINEKRCEVLMSPASPLSYQVKGVSTLYNSPYRSNIFYIHYDELVTEKQNILDDLYDFLQIKKYSHNFENIERLEIEDDSQYGMLGFHKVHKSIQLTNRKADAILSPYIYNKYKHLTFGDFV